MKVIIAEKPFVAREIAAALNVTSKADGYIYNDKYCVTWAFGHLIELCPPEEYGWKQWDAKYLPMLPPSFKLRPTHRYNAEKKVSYIDPGVAKQLKTIEQLFSKADEIIIATDAGREGELIFGYIYEYLNCNKKCSRLWISVLTKSTILKGFDELKKWDISNSLLIAAKCRSSADWLVGYNSSRGLSIAAGQFTYSLGRVQTPTLAMVCSRYLENKNFVPAPYYTIKLFLNKDNFDFTAISKIYTDKNVAQSFYKKVAEVNNAEIISVEKTEKTISAPLLYDLTTLQRDANKILDFSAEKTLNTAQSLYEKGVISYPRTGSCYISEDILNNIPQLLKVASKNENFKPQIEDLLKRNDFNKRSVNESKITDHHALITTEVFPTNLNNDEQYIYELILIRLLEAISPNCKTDVTYVEINCNTLPFKATGTIVKVDGWKSINKSKATKNGAENSDNENLDDEQNSNQILPILIPKEIVKKAKECLESKLTKPNPIHTEASLLLAMETCGKHIEDETLKEAIKDCGLGTPATRANNIETLIKRAYIIRDKKKLIPTEKGLFVYKHIKHMSIASPELTGLWEKKLNLIQMENINAEVFLNEIKQYTTDISSELLQLKNVFETVSFNNNISQYVCPKCKKGKLVKSKFDYLCSDKEKSNCDFKIPLQKGNKNITETQIKDLVNKGKTSIIKGFVSKLGKVFDAPLIVTTDFKVEYFFSLKK